MEKIAALEDAIEKKSLVGIYSVFYTIAHGDPNFSTGKFRQLMDYVKSKEIDGFLQEYDGEKFEPEEKWDEDYWALIASSLVDNFCEERINHLEAIGKIVYPVKKIEKTASVRDEVIEENGMSKRSGHSNRLISEERKDRVKSQHANRTRRDGGGLLSKILGSK